MTQPVNNMRYIIYVSVIISLFSKSAFCQNRLFLGNHASFIVTDEGKLFAVGFNRMGQLGIGSNTDQLSLISVRGLEDRKIDFVVAGNYRVFAITQDQKIFAWGHNSSGPLGIPSRGGENQDERWDPIEIPSLRSYRIISLAAQGFHSVALLDDGRVLVWGSNNFGQLGLGDQESRPNPTLMTGPFAKQKIASIASGVEHTIALTEDRALYSWGSNSSGQLGLGFKSDFVSIPTKITIGIQGEDIASVATGYNHTLALTENGKVYSWGSNETGQLGLESPAAQDTPTQIKGDLLQKRVISISANNNYSMALTEDGNVYVWGWNYNGQLGLGDEIDRTLPTRIDSLSHKRIATIQAGFLHTAVQVENDDAFYLWGNNHYGQLMTNSIDRKVSPILVRPVIPQ